MSAANICQARSAAPTAALWARVLASSWFAFLVRASRASTLLLTYWIGSPGAQAVRGIATSGAGSSSSSPAATSSALGGGAGKGRPSRRAAASAAAAAAPVKPRIKWDDDESAPSAPQLRAVDKAAQAAQLAAQLAENEEALEVEDDLEAEDLEDEDMW